MRIMGRRAWSRELGGGSNQLLPVGVGLGAGREVLHRAFEHPEADDVHEGSILAAAGAVVGDAGGKGFGAEERLVAFEADEGPGAGAEENVRAVRRSGHGVVGAGRVVAGDGDDLGGGDRIG